MGKFLKASDKKVIERLNNAPGGEEGVDADVKKELEEHGICAGMTVAWIASVLNSDPEAVQSDLFENYFLNYLRFQGAFLQVKKRGSVEKFKALGKHYPHGCSTFNYQHYRAVRMKKQVTGHIGKTRKTWAAYASATLHAIGIARIGDLHYAMDPNRGLFIYNNEDRFYEDLEEHFQNRLEKKDVSLQAQFEFTFWEKKAT